jgi:hypothetical protein
MKFSIAPRALLRALCVADVNLPDLSAAPLFEDDHQNDPEVQQAWHLIGSIGFRLATVVEEFIENLRLYADRKSLSEDAEAFVDGMRKVTEASRRIQMRSRVARDDAHAGRAPKEATIAEEAVARWFSDTLKGDPEVGRSPGETIAYLDELATELQRRGEQLPSSSKGRPSTPRCVIIFVKQAADLFEEISGTRATAPKASGDRRDEQDVLGSERRSQFVAFTNELCSGAGLEPLKSSAIRSALALRSCD